MSVKHEFNIIIYRKRKKILSNTLFLQYFQNLKPENPRNKFTKIVETGSSNEFWRSSVGGDDGIQRADEDYLEAPTQGVFFGGGEQSPSMNHLVHKSVCKSHLKRLSRAAYSRLGKWFLEAEPLYESICLKVMIKYFYFYFFFFKFSSNVVFKPKKNCFLNNFQLLRHCLKIFFLPF